jgi:hypothetical protein
MDASSELTAYQSYRDGYGWGIRTVARWGGRDDVDLIHVQLNGSHSTTASRESLEALARTLDEYLYPVSGPVQSPPRLPGTLGHSLPGES